MKSIKPGLIIRFNYNSAQWDISPIDHYSSYFERFPLPLFKLISFVCIRKVENIDTKIKINDIPFLINYIRTISYEMNISSYSTSP